MKSKKILPIIVCVALATWATVAVAGGRTIHVANSGSGVSVGCAGTNEGDYGRRILKCMVCFHNSQGHIKCKVVSE